MLFPDLVPRALVTLTKRGVTVMGEREARASQELDSSSRYGFIALAFAQIGLGQLSAAAETYQKAGISYRTAWSVIQQMEQALGRPMVVSRAGGSGGGATTLTDECRQLLGLYQDLRRHLEESVTRLGQSPELAVQAGD